MTVRNLIYKLYERSLERGLRPEDLPRHIGVILDGNRRWAERQGSASASHGHEVGAKKTIEFLGWCDDLGIKVVTLYLLSTDNLKGRAEAELQELQDIIGQLATDLAATKRWRLQLVGDRASLPAGLESSIAKAEKSTGKIDGLHVNLAVGYGGRKEIADAMRSILRQHAQEGTTIDELAELLDPDLITKHLYTSGQPDPDLVIRTSGEQRLSGFLLWQSAQSEFYFEEALWPDFRRVDFLRAIRAFESRHRRFGA
jgi:short-chain Z-isoprenyl diphosphate synthase